MKGAPSVERPTVAPPAVGPSSASDPGAAVVLYDGVCGLCNRYVAFVLRRDHQHIFRFASLEGPFGTSARSRHRLPADGDLRSIVLLERAGTRWERARVRSDAVIAVLGRLGGAWPAVRLLRVIPPVLRDAVYDLIARLRYRMFGRLDACPLPSPSERERFLD